MRILIAFDESPPSLAAIRDLVRAGLPARAEARVFTVIPPWIPPGSAVALSDIPAWTSGAYLQDLEGAREARKAGLEMAGRGRRLLQARFPHWDIGTATAVADPAPRLVEEARAWRADLLVLGSHGRSALGRLILGSVARRVLDQAACPVRIGRAPRRRSTPPRLLLAVDGSPESLAATGWVAERTWPVGTEIRILSVLEHHTSYEEALFEGRRGGKPGATPLREWLERMQEKARQVVERGGVRVSQRILQGKPSSSLLEETARFRPDTVFLGTRGITGLDRFFMGGVSLAVAMRAACSVEVYRRWPNRQAGSPRRTVRKRRTAGAPMGARRGT